MTALDGVPRYEDWMTDRIPSDDGEWILACDAERAIGEAVEAVSRGYQSVYERALHDAITAVARTAHDLYCVVLEPNYDRPCNCPRGEALDAIHALLAEGSE